MPPTGAKAEQALRKRKEAKQKKILIALAPVLLALVAWQGPKTFKALTGGSAPPQPAAQATTAASTTTSPTDPTSAPPSTASGGAPASSAGPTALPETDIPAHAESGQLVSFDRFVGKDPFRQQVSTKPAGDGSASPAPGQPGAISGPVTITPPSGGGGGGGGGGGSPGGGSGATSIATLDVNGDREAVSVGSAFPSSDPIFRLVSLKGSTAKIGLVSGSFSSGTETISLKVGKSVTLVSQPDGLRYTVTFISLA